MLYNSLSNPEVFLGDGALGVEQGKPQSPRIRALDLFSETEDRVSWGG